MRILFLCLVFLQGGCSLHYIAHVSRGQMQLMKGREKIEEVIQKDDLTAQQKLKLKFVLEVRKYAIESLGLSASQSYTQFVDIKRDVVAYNLVVCPKDHLKPYDWWFPFIGNVEYLGFFDKKYALETQKEYEEEGYDTYLRGVSAYSTLGWFDDAVFSTMLKYDEGSLANIIIHELTHATIYKKGDTAFNEGVATFVGNKGSLAFLIQTFEKKSKIVKRTKDLDYDELLFSKFIDRSLNELNRYYQSLVSSEVKIKKREDEFVKIKRNFLKLKLQFKTHAYDYFEKLSLNNAILISFAQYQKDLNIFEKVWIKQKKDIKRMVEFLKKIQDEDEPMGYLKD